MARKFEVSIEYRPYLDMTPREYGVYMMLKDLADQRGEVLHLSAKQIAAYFSDTSKDIISRTLDALIERKFIEHDSMERDGMSPDPQITLLNPKDSKQREDSVRAAKLRLKDGRSGAAEMIGTKVRRKV